MKVAGTIAGVVTRPLLSLLLLSGLIASSGCAGRSSMMEEKSAAPEAGGGAALDAITDFENQLATREQELRGYGVYLPSAPSGGAARAIASNPDAGGGDVAPATAAEGQLSGFGDDVDAATPASEPEPTPPAAEAESPADVTSERSSRDARRDKKARARQCKQVCEIKAAICQLETNICTLAERHRGEARYADACARASTDCAVASRACDDCSD